MYIQFGIYHVQFIKYGFYMCKNAVILYVQGNSNESYEEKLSYLYFCLLIYT